MHWIEKIYYKILLALTIEHRRSIMCVSYDLTTNTVKCVDWISSSIREFSGTLTPRIWRLIKNYSNLSETFPYTKIYIWSGMETKHLAYCEPIHNYLKNPELLKTGQGFHFGSGKRYAHRYNINEEQPLPPKKCPTCFQIIKQLKPI